MKLAASRLLVALLVLAACPSFALDQKYFAGQLHMFERTERYESIHGGAITYLRPTGKDEFEIPDDAILLEGVISRELLSHVRRLIAQRSTYTIYLDSPGGDLLAGMELGSLLHETESVAVVPWEAQCKSACALAFLGAPVRMVLGLPSSLGFHRQYRIIDGKVTYGDVAADRRLVHSYLRSVDAKGVTAEEVVATTGQITFSDAALSERRLVTVTREQFLATSKRLISMSGMTQFEIISAVCARYDRARMNGASLEVITTVLTCSGRKPAIREPLLKVAITPWPFTPSQELELLGGKGVIEALRSDDPLVIAAFNLAADEGRNTYQRYLDRRRAVRDKQEKP